MASSFLADRTAISVRRSASCSTNSKIVAAKLDKSLADKVEDDRMKILLKNTIRMLKEIGAEVLVEGVETKEVLQQFIELGCDYIQGYYFSKRATAPWQTSVEEREARKYGG